MMETIPDRDGIHCVECGETVYDFSAMGRRHTDELKACRRVLEMAEEEHERNGNPSDAEALEIVRGLIEKMDRLG